MCYCDIALCGTLCFPLAAILNFDFEKKLHHLTGSLWNLHPKCLYKELLYTLISHLRDIIYEVGVFGSSHLGFRTIVNRSQMFFKWKCDGFLFRRL